VNSFSKEGFRRKLASLILEHGNFDEVDHEDETLLSGVAKILEESHKEGAPRPCCSCKKMLDCLPEIGDWSTYQADGGCEIKIVGSYGSRHDLTTFRGIICDDCVSELSLERERCNF